MRPIARNRRLLLALVAALAMGHAMAADELGTLFTTPQERARLDKLRRGEPVAPAAEAAAGVPKRKPAITGYVQRSDGRNTVWIDGRPVVIAAPGAKVLEPGIVRSHPSERVLRVEPEDPQER